MSSSVTMPLVSSVKSFKISDDTMASSTLRVRQLKTRLHLIRPDVGVKVIAEQTKQKAKHDRHAKVQTFQPGELVYALRYHGNTASWVPGTIHLQTGPVSYTNRLADGTIA